MPRLVLLLVALASACASAPPPPSVSPRDPSSPRAEETPVTPVTEPSPALAPKHDHDDGPVVYTCPMHPEIAASDPTKRCPICGMVLVPKRRAP